MTSSTLIQPVDNFIREGFAEQIKKQFRCPAVFVSSVDKLRNLQALLGNKSPTYPYIFLSVQDTVADVDSYATNRLARHGIPVSLNADNHQVQTAKLLPVKFEIELIYTTNKYGGVETDSVEGFVRRWLAVRRNGSLNFNVDYGLTQMSISYQLVDTIPITPRENPADQESVYAITATATVHGFISEPELGSVGRINQIQLADGHPGSISGAQFFPF